MAEITAKHLADFILAETKRRNIDVTNLKLQKLLYYCQGWYLAITDEPLFDERIEAWIHGPVVPRVFGLFKEHRWRKIPSVATSRFPLDESRSDYPMSEHVSRILDAYGDLSGQDLESLTHSEAPWVNARNGLPPDVASNSIISLESMRQYFSARLIDAD